MPGFSSRYKTKRLVYFEAMPDALVGIAREKEIKAWRREKKVALIEKRNPDWKDLSKELGLSEG
jgi:putative endonuclease